jgi:hypothetical protein
MGYLRKLLLEIETLGRFFEIVGGEEEEAILAEREKELAERERKEKVQDVLANWSYNEDRSWADMWEDDVQLEDF